jgi:EAL domain-containing protein (putative c-di-GMP-specific phosphodiesterase class I)
VNISARDFNNPRFVDDIERMTYEAGVDAHRMKLEVTETTLVDQPEVAAQALTRLRDGGYSLAIDDFGTGYSSLSYLHKFPFDTLKIDRGFVKRMNTCQKSDEIVGSIAALANHLSLAVVAEGVETEEQEKAITDLDCAYAQGYLYARPMPEPEAIAFAKNWGEGMTNHSH